MERQIFMFLLERFVYQCQDNDEYAYEKKILQGMMMMIAFITIKSVPLIEGLCAQTYFRFEISVVCSHLLLFFFVKEKTC